VKGRVNDILLIDAYKGVATALARAGCPAVKRGSFGQPGRSDDHLAAFRDPREFSVIVSDCFNASQNWVQEHEDWTAAARASGERVLIPSWPWPGGGAPPPPADPLSRYSFGFQQRRLFAEALARGGLMFVFVGPSQRIELPTGRAARGPRTEPFLQAFGGRYGVTATHIGGPFCYLDVDADPKEENLTPGPASVRSGPDSKYADAFRGYAEAFGPDMRWHASWSIQDLTRSTKPTFRLFSNVVGDSVGVVQERFRLDPQRFKGHAPGLLVLLPNIVDVQRRAEAVVFLLREVVPVLRPGLLPRWPPPPTPVDEWLAAYDPPGIAARRAELETRRRRAEAGWAAEQEVIDAGRAAIAPYKDLLRLMGDELKNAVAVAFRDGLGFSVADLDDRYPSGQRRADLLAERGPFAALIEAKSAGRTSLKRDDVNAFIANIRKHTREHGPVAARVLVVNAQAERPPAERNALAAEVVELAAENGITILTCPQLLGLIECALAGQLPAPELERVLTASGWAGGDVPA
jgi:hypothetical protein